MSKKRKSQSNIPLAAEHRSILFWLIMGFVMLFLFIAPFYRGLFNGGQWSFEGPIYWSILWSMIALLLIAIPMFKHWKLDNMRDLLSLAIWLVPLSYLISTWNAASAHSAMNGVYVHVMYTVFFLIGLVYARSKLGLQLIVYSIVGAGYMLLVFGFLNWFGNVNYTDAVLGIRLSNVFQYPNTYAAYLIALYFATLLLISRAKQWYAVSLYALTLVPIFTSILLTNSKGGLVVLPMVLLVYLFFIPLRQQILHLIYIVLSVIASLLLLQPLTDIRRELVAEQTAALSWQGWLLLIVGSAVVSGIVYVVHRFAAQKLTDSLREAESYSKINLILPAATLVIGIIGAYLLLGTSVITDQLPESLSRQIERINLEDRSVESRTTFYKDSLQVIKDYPVFGAGGGGWASLYDAYKSYPYTSRQAHNFFLQYMVEVGLLGFVIFSLIAGVSLALFFKRYFKQPNKEGHDLRIVLFIIPLALLLHSMFDFDMTFLYLTALIFLCLGALASAGADSSWPALNRLKADRWKAAVPSVMIVIALIVAFITFQQGKASSYYSRHFPDAVKSQDYNQLTKVVDSALSVHPSNPAYQLQKISLLRQAYAQTEEQRYYNDAYERIEKLKKREPYHRQLLEEEFMLLVSDGEIEQAMHLLTDNLALFPWDMSLYERRIQYYFEQGNEARAEQRAEDMEQYWREAFSVYQEVMELRAEVDEIASTVPNRTFGTTPIVAMYIGQIHYLQGDYELAAALFDTGRTSSRNFEDPINRMNTRWFLAAGMKLDENNNSLYNRFIEFDPAEEQVIEELLRYEVE